MNKSNKSVLAATIFFLPSLGFASASLESENVLLDLQAKVETLYQHVSEGKNDSLLRNVQQKLGEATTLKNEADEIRLNLQADVETLFPILSSDADEKLRSIQGCNLPQETNHWRVQCIQQCVQFAIWQSKTR